MSDGEPEPPGGVDVEVLAGLRVALGAQAGEGLAQILAVFFEEGRKRLEAIQAALQQGDGRTVQLCAHTLRGSAELLGARRLAGLSGRLERAADGPLEGLGPLFAELRGEYDGVSRRLREEL